MATVFGEVAGVYDRVRPGYPAEIGSAILAYHGGAPAQVVELGAGPERAPRCWPRWGRN